MQSKRRSDSKDFIENQSDRLPPTSKTELLAVMEFFWASKASAKSRDEQRKEFSEMGKQRKDSGVLPTLPTFTWSLRADLRLSFAKQQQALYSIVGHEMIGYIQAVEISPPSTNFELSSSLLFAPQIVQSQCSY